ncbi:MAG: hypothetical protein WC975_03985 [Phycisphaerae bacterium]
MRILLKLWVVGLILFVQNCSAANPKSQSDVVSVRVKGQDMDRESALNDALRKAVERGGHLEIYARSETENYTLARDTVLAQATGLIKDYRVLKEGEDPLGGYFVEIEAQVDRRIIDATWGQVQILLQELGTPKILVNIVERVNDLALKTDRDIVEYGSLLENKIEQLLVQKGFELVDKNQIQRLKRDKMKQATIAQNISELKQLAGDLGAQMFIVGFARASGPQVSDVDGIRLYMWETDVTLKAFWSETGQILFNRSEVGTRGGSRAPGPPGAKSAIAKAADKLAYQCLEGILETWSKQAVNGGKVVLDVNGLDFQQMLVLQDGLKQIEGIKNVTRRAWHKPTAKFELVTVHSAEKLAEILQQAQFQEFRLEIENQKFNAIEAVLKVLPLERLTTRPATTKPVTTRPAMEM